VVDVEWDGKYTFWVYVTSLFQRPRGLKSDAGREAYGTGPRITNPPIKDWRVYSTPGGVRVEDSLVHS
jgi:hypothetical protein